MTRINSIQIFNKYFGFSEDNLRRDRNRNETKYPYTLEEVFPQGHTLNDLASEVVMITGDNSSGKTTMLKEIASSMILKKHFEEEEFSKLIQGWSGSDKTPLVTDWKRSMGEWTIHKYFSSEYFSTEHFKKHQLTKQKNLINQINRNSNLGNGKEIQLLAEQFTEKYSMDIIETLNRIKFIVDCGLYLASQPIKESMFSNIAIETIEEDNSKPKEFNNIIYRDFTKIEEEKGKSAGELVKEKLSEVVILAKENDLILLDEPTTSLSRKGIEFVIEQIEGLPGQKFISTHEESLINTFYNKESPIIDLYKSPAVVVKK